MRYWGSVGLLVAWAGLVWAQAPEPPKTCETQLSEAQISLELLERDTKQARTQAAADLSRWIQRAQAAEKRVAQQASPPAEGKPEPKAEGK